MECCICKKEMNCVETVSCAEEAICVFNMPHTIHYGETMLFRCPNCSHMQIANEINREVYEGEYIVDYSSWKDMQKKDENYFAKIVGLLEKAENIVEIGCGEGRSLQVAGRFFEKVYGIEPAVKQAELARKRVFSSGGVVINDFFTDKYQLPVLFDAFYSKMTFEHLENPCAILHNIGHFLKPGGIGWLNVPNGQKIYNENLYQLFSYVHIQYYTPLSINTMLQRAGFEIIELDTHPIKDGEIAEIDVIFRKPWKKCGKFAEQKAKDIEDIKKYISCDEKVTIWGAGTKAHKYIELFDGLINIQHIVDKNFQKHGKYISKLKIPIEKVTYEIIHESDVVIIFASMYNKEIVKELRQMNFNGKIVLFEDGSLKLM